MVTIYRTNDVLKLKVHELTVGISPLTFEQKMQIQLLHNSSREEGPMRAAKLACQYAVKEISGIKVADGSDYKIQIENGRLTDECWDDLMNVKETEKLVTICINLLNGVPNEFIDPATGKKLEGVKIIEDAKEKKK